MIITHLLFTSKQYNKKDIVRSTPNKSNGQFSRFLFEMDIFLVSASFVKYARKDTA